MASPRRSAVVLMASAGVAIVWANVHGASYRAVFGETVRELVTQGLMTLFFFVVGMEIKRELPTPSQMLLPAAAALGGMLVPALIYLTLNPGDRGWGIPIATDIAFCAGVLALLGNRIPRALIVFVTALAIFDDIGGIAVIALFYGGTLHAAWLALAVSLAGVLLAMNVRGVSSTPAWAFVGVVLWYVLHRGGVHATLSGVALGVAIPRPVLKRFLGRFQPPVETVVMPLFALASCGVELAHAGVSRIALGVALGLFIGKPLGIFSMTAIAVKARLAPSPGGASFGQLFGASVIAGIGFTVSLFIATLAFGDSVSLEHAKLGIIVGSLASGAVGALLLNSLTARGAGGLRQTPTR